ncbi:hypothetical protein SAMN05216207_1001100 [Pseudonocardia ammonioxydans]|uniref:Uncharacterized protein n=1 Tax=Pseudonocardia ammonioxydans TaxID=260086 RepID=A0A1I4RWG2_PSUAM|nr:hypothetical protein [Pseudonocardia ammonioxydans]SFM56602.1 hypothetical protein SAMN05216207_1001100 [Pseudonocardia ammonioxydans]
MSETPGRKPRHALSDTGPSVPVQSGPPEDLFGTGDADPGPDVPEQSRVEGPFGQQHDQDQDHQHGRGQDADRDPAAAVERTAPATALSDRDPVVPHPSSPGDDLSGDGGLFRDGGDLFGDDGEAPTRALPVVPRPREDDAGRSRPSIAAVAQLPEPFRPAPVQGAAAGRPGSGRFRLPELPPTVRPVLPAVLGAATALILALGVVAGVNGAPDPQLTPPPPAPESGP